MPGNATAERLDGSEDRHPGVGFVRPGAGHGIQQALTRSASTQEDAVPSALPQLEQSRAPLIQLIAIEADALTLRAPLCHARPRQEASVA